VAQVIYSLEALSDLERVEEFFGEDVAMARKALARIFDCVTLLRSSPELGRPVAGGLRELVISRGATGYLALYRFDARLDLVRVLRLRRQRETGYPFA
jgi:plasmid stabilization system protein ParE